MRWGLLSLILLAGGCGTPVDDSPPPFLLLRHHHADTKDDDAPDGGAIPAQTIGDKGDPGQPID
jgi:hypothetical protein